MASTKNKSFIFKNIKNCVFSIFIFISATHIAFAAYPADIPKNFSNSNQWVFKHASACLQADNIHRINANGECLAIQTYYDKNRMPNNNPRLLIFIHGDGIPGGGPSDYLKFQATNFLNSDTISVILMRPGYYDSYGNYSTGESHAFSCNGYPCDAYRAETVATLAAAIKSLKEFYHPSCTILVGHSGGAMMSGVILGKYPGLADGAVLASIVDNVPAWANRHKWGNWSNSLSPNDWVNQIPKNNFVYIVSGTKDDNTFPEMAKKYYTSLQQMKINSYFISVKDGTHNSIVNDNANEFDDAILSALKKCQH